VRWLLASTLSCVVFSATSLATFLPLRDGDRVQYLFVAPGGLKLLAMTVVIAAALGCLFFAVTRRAERAAPDRLVEARSGRWLAPLTPLGIAAFGVIPAVPGIGEPAAFVSYFLYDLRWWWLAAAMLWLCVRVHPLAGRPLARRWRWMENQPTPVRLLVFDSILMAAVMLYAAATTPLLRFDSSLNGDEPKYVRYCELWYQGRGLDVLGRQLFRDLPLDAESHVARNATLLARSIGEESRALVEDMRAFIQSPGTFRWNRGVREDGFVRGKRGGLYQIYLPGVSVFLFPGYFLDRHVIATRAGDSGEWPAELILSNMSLLALYGFCAVALFRLLRHVLKSDVLALFWSAVGIAALPTAAFAFQFYPETAALLVVLLVTIYVWAHAPTATWIVAAAAGAGAAGLAWFHPRFLLLSASLIVVAAVRTRHRCRFALVGAALLMYLSVGAYAYRATGSWSPTAFWDAPGGDQALELQGAPVGVLGYALHRRWGMAPHTPLLLGALPGIAVVARQSTAQASFLLLIPLTLAIPAASHTLHAAGSSPGRLIVAIVPLLIWPVAVLVRTFWHSIAIRASTILALILTLETAVSYNWNHVKRAGAIRSMGESGWRPNLAFPIVAGEGWQDSGSNVALLLLVVAALLILTIAAFLAARFQERRGSSEDQLSASPGARAGSRSVTVMPGLTVAALVLAAGTATAFNRDWTYWEYSPEDLHSRRQAAAALVERDRCRACFSTESAAIDWRWLEPNAAEGVILDASTDGRRATIQLQLAGSEDSLRFGRVRLDFGDGSESAWVDVVGARRLVHEYRQPGTYELAAWMQLRNGTMRGDHRTLTITGTN
jgi:hypothetical protein